MARKTKKSKKQKMVLTSIIVLAIVLFLFSYYGNDLIDILLNDSNNVTEEKNDNDEIINNSTINNNEEDKKNSENKDNSENIFQNEKNYKQENLNRYVSYKEKNPNLSNEQIITRVNIGLDYEFYGYISNTDMEKGYLILTNKYKKLESDYEPDDLEEISSDCFISGNLYVRKMRKEAKENFERLCLASIENGTPVYGQSAYREYAQQEKLYNNAVSSMGQKAADNDTARAGHSEHQTGLTIDVSSTKAGNMLSFHKTDSYNWMLDNAHKYGFILRYPLGYESIHGFVYESWHYRYVGVDVATDMHDNYPNLTYDEYYYMFID